MKSLVNPLLIVLAAQVFGLWLLARKLPKPWTRLVWGLVAISLSLAVVATPAASRWLESTLLLPGNNYGAMDVEPRYIFVLGGGYQPGPSPREDLLIFESQRRTLHGAEVWKKYPDATLILSGASPRYAAQRPMDRHAELMAEMAHQYGVPRSAMVLESRSTNTAEHVVEALKLPGVTPTTPIALVTSRWHMRRAKNEFCRYFELVLPMPVPSPPATGQWRDWVPDADALDGSTTFLREWVGGAWYWLKGHGERSGRMEAKC